MALLKGKEGIGASIKRSGIHEKGEISLRQILSSVRSNPDFYKAGAIGIFVGVVRGEAPDGSRVERLELEAYEEEAEKAREALTSFAKQLFPRDPAKVDYPLFLLGRWIKGKPLNPITLKEALHLFDHLYKVTGHAHVFYQVME